VIALREAACCALARTHYRSPSDAPTEDGNATALRPFDDERMLVNFSVWESAEALHTFVYRTQHAEVMRYRREWFERLDQPFTVLWWVRAGHRPTV